MNAFIRFYDYFKEYDRRREFKPFTFLEMKDFPEMTEKNEAKEEKDGS